ncbi:MAG: hypothetical protein N4P90_01015 [Candidatus Lightella neohaematopini]|nr:hypothetical protein [Candidatus Lightella neohaematopini]
MKIELSITYYYTTNALVKYVFSVVLYVMKINNLFLRNKIIRIIGIVNIGYLYYKFNTYGIVILSIIR